MDQSALHRRAERLATAWLATGCLVAVGVMVGVLGDAAAPLVSLAGLGGMITGIALHRPKPMSPWLGMAVAMLCFMAGGVLRVMCGTLGDMSSTRSILPDLATLPGYLLGALALARLVAVLLPDSDRLPAVIDSGAAAVAMFILAWVFVIEPLTHRPNVSATAVGLQLLYPVASVVMVSIAARLAFVTFSQNSRTLRLVFVSLCLSLLGDLLYLVADSGIAHVSSRWLDVPYLLAFTAFPAAMLHPDLAGVGSVRSSVRSISRRRAAFVTVAIAAPSLIVVLWTGHDTLDRWVLGPAVLLLLVLVAARMGHALVEASRHQARFAYLASHDELTGLPNRREIRRRLLDEGDAASMIAAVIDVDRFQLVNDTFDHDLGDALIRLVADRIAGLCGTDWVVGHAGGAQYLAIGAASEGPALFERLEHLRVKLADRYEVNGSEFRVTASIGVASEGGSERAACCATPTPRCTRPRRAAVIASSRSTQECTSARSAGCVSNTTYAARSSATSSRCTTSPWSSCRTSRFAVSRRSSVGITRSSARWLRSTSYRSPRTPGSSDPSVRGCSTARSASSPRGATRSRVGIACSCR